MIDVRYFRGRHRIAMIKIGGKKSLIQHLEKGRVGNKMLGYKNVNMNDLDIVSSRSCWKNKKSL